MSSELNNTKEIYQKIYRSVFWIGYVMVLVAAFIPFEQDLHDKTLSIVTIKFHLDQVLHTVVYFLIYLYFLSGQYLRVKLFNEKPLKRFILLVFILATITEAIQIFIPYRAFNVFDWLANIIGICLGLTVIYIMRVSKVNINVEVIE